MAAVGAAGRYARAGARQEGRGVALLRGGRPAAAGACRSTLGQASSGLLLSRPRAGVPGRGSLVSPQLCGGGGLVGPG